MWTCAKQHKPPVPEPGSRPEFASAVPGTQLVGRETAAPDALAAETVQRARAYLLAARADSTRRAYANDWVHFTDWCTSQHDEGGGLLGYLPAAPETVAIYLAEHAGTLKVATLIRRCSAISAVHQAAGHPSPTASPLVRTTLAGIRRVHGISPAAKDPLVAHQVRRLLDALPKEPAKALLAARDRALLVLGFYGALRRSELVALDTGDVDVNDQGLVVTLRRSKTDQDAAGRRIAMLHTGAADSCPAEVYLAWLAALDTALPPLFGQGDDDRWVVLRVVPFRPALARRSCLRTRRSPEGYDPSWQVSRFGWPSTGAKHCSRTGPTRRHRIRPDRRPASRRSLRQTRQAKTEDTPPRRAAEAAPIQSLRAATAVAGDVRINCGT